MAVLPALLEGVEAAVVDAGEGGVAGVACAWTAVVAKNPEQYKAVTDAIVRILNWAEDVMACSQFSTVHCLTTHDRSLEAPSVDSVIANSHDSHLRLWIVKIRKHVVNACWGNANKLLEFGKRVDC
ncbi:hypothetical protein [Paraburkholderia sp. GAS333]|uniref:hypothetical protein n=1 Tax=Paraburkholderia sp. GAS333 TaxID=3156279 RepID=UPI003D2633DE